MGDRVNDLVSSGINLIDISLYETNILKVSQQLDNINKVFRTRLNKVILRSTLEQDQESLFEVGQPG